MSDKKLSDFEEFAIREGVDPAETANDMRAIRALSGLINAATIFYSAPEGSEEEAKAHETLNDAMEKLKRSPDGTAELFTHLLTAVAWVQTGGTLQGYFEGFGIDSIMVRVDQEGSQDD